MQQLMQDNGLQGTVIELNDLLEQLATKFPRRTTKSTKSSYPTKPTMPEMPKMPSMPSMPGMGGGATDLKALTEWGK